ncbi:topoisomerase C-terminal repeat-containing protein [Desulfamplus magnetovallimortis]|uniref:topoisomerase C-terminal repeat-containing protein n=1 Tax=Desulfamplus magnetovallimortis TaxID=1246637 RepID=UPI0009B97182|nr:hypothetical protein [Desulfamplus magnetovallimortis]
MIIEGNKGYGCSNWRVEQGDCRFVIWKDIMGRKLTPDNISTLIAGKITRSYVLKPGNGKKLKGRLKMIQLENRRYAVKIIPEDEANDSDSSENQIMMIECFRG